MTLNTSINNYYQPVSLVQRRLPQKPAHNTGKVLTFKGSDVDSFFMTPKIFHQNVTDAQVRHINSDRYKSAVKEWDHYVETSKATKVAKGVLIGTSAYGGHIIGKLTGAEGLGDAAGAVGGFAFENVGKKFIRAISEPNEELEKRGLDCILASARTGGARATDADRLDRRVNKNESFVFSIKDDIKGVVAGFVSPIEKEQDVIKAVLPKLKGKVKTREKVVPTIQKHYDAEFNDKFSWFGPSKGDNIFSDILFDVLQDVTVFAKPTDMKELYPQPEEAKAHLKDVVPKAIRYLKG